MKKNNKTCIVCSKVYTYCPTCREYKKYPKWMTIFCCENCKKVFETASDYLANAISKEEAKAAFDACDLSNKAEFDDSILAAIEEVYGGVSKTAKKTAPVQKTEKNEVQKTEKNEVQKEQTNSEK